jgi:murein DD-endopeptidase MepM/ murein hydrolase activator NlpD
MPSDARPDASKHRRFATRALQIACCALLAAAGIWQARRQAPVIVQLPALHAVPVAALAATPSLAPGFETIEVIVRSNDTLDRIFRKFELSLADLANLRALEGVRRLLDRLMPGEQLRLIHREGSLVSLERDLSLTEKLQVQRDDQGFRADIVAKPVSIEPRVAHGVIESSLFESANAAGLQDVTVLQLAHIFGWDIDFVLDLRRGDEFDVSYERISQHGKYVQDGEILAARFVNQGHEYRAVRYKAADGSVGYYTPEGRSVEKAFLRAPLEFRRVSSRFSSGRYHPILNRVRAHKGVDYAAATGTPVQAAGAGRVRFRGQKGGYGNVLEIDHGGGIVTVYGHLSRFAAAARSGARVAQGATIGYVGMSGLATGPHLHYEYRLNGQYLDPQRVQLPDARPIDAALLANFQRQAAPLLAALHPQPAPALATR